MKPAELLKSRVSTKTTKQDEVEKAPSLLDILRKHNRELEERQQRKVLIRRVRKL